MRRRSFFSFLSDAANLSFSAEKGVLFKKALFVHNDPAARRYLHMRFGIPEAIIGIIRHDDAGMRRNMPDLPGHIAFQLHEDFFRAF